MAFTQEQIIAALHETKGLLFLAAKRVGCDVRTIRRYIKRYKAVADAVADAKGSMVDLAEGKLYQAINKGEAWAICFYLKTQAKNRGYVERQEIAETDTKGRSVYRFPVIAKSSKDWEAHFAKESPPDADAGPDTLH